ncbi:MAG: hypothetical protein A2Z18_01635 [Armatimonadetes bacterium RBG_16_58_9]|nr:MAG: hypothetical protein A2Z18_01635 [Armatimonadetes bacterium RBG_16_58_9]
MIAFNAFWWEALDSEDKIASVCESLAKLGYRGVEWKETCFGGNGDMTQELRTAARITRASGLDVTDFVILRNLVDPAHAAKSTEDVCNFVRAAAQTGVKLVNTAPAPAVTRSVPAEEWWVAAGPDWATSWGTLEQSLGEVLKVAESEGIVIVFEAAAGTLVHDYYSTRELLRRLDSPSLAITMDPSHYVLHDNDAAWAIRQLGTEIRHVHLKDAIGHPGTLGRDFLFPILGEGGVDWNEFFCALNDTGYSGWLSVEFESFKYMHEVLAGDGVEAARLSMRSYRALAGFRCFGI